ncbi:DUF4350 domain-containing protein [Streptomyces sp. NPDC054796]
MSSSDASTSLSPTARQLWKRARGLLIAAAVLAAAGVILAAMRSGGHHGVLDPRSADRYGSRAAAELLAQQGVDTEVATTITEAAAKAGPDTTLLVAQPDSLSENQRSKIREATERGGRTILVAPGRASASELAPGVRAAAPAEIQPTPPDCDFPAAERAGDADLGGLRYAGAPRHADACYLHQGLPSLLRLPADRGHGDSGTSPDTGDTVLLGAPDPLYNDRLGHRGNASLALQLLGSREHLVWYLPSPSDTSATDSQNRGFFALLPDGWTWALLQLGIAAVLAALWRARRLGPLVPERLPVSVRASEATEGRARLYRRAHARDRAADALRTATRTRLAPLVGVPLSQAHSPEVLAPAMAAHTPADMAPPPTGPVSPVSGPPQGDEPTVTDSAGIRALLFGAPPQDDTALIQLADELDRLERRMTAASPAPSPTDKDRTP